MITLRRFKKSMPSDRKRDVVADPCKQLYHEIGL